MLMVNSGIYSPFEEPVRLLAEGRGMFQVPNETFL
jgi:hypothetical protein